MFDFIKKIFALFAKKTEQVNLGAILESAEVIAARPQHTEIVASVNAIDWGNIDITKLPEYTVYDQGQQSSCVAHSRALMCAIIYWLRTGTWVDFSRAFIYRQRANYPAGGMFAGDSAEIVSKGLLPDALMPSTGLSEGALNDIHIEDYMHDVADGIKAGTPIVIPAGDFDRLVSTMQTVRKPITVWFDINTSEYSDVPTMTKQSNARHAVTFIPPKNTMYPTWGIYNGKKAIVIQDSWSVRYGIAGKRIITEDFYRSRNVYADYFMRFKFDESGIKMPYDGTVKSLQDCLKLEGLFPANIESTGVMGVITTQAVKDFQKRYNIAQTGVVGPLTTSKLKELYPFII